MIYTQHPTEYISAKDIQIIRNDAASANRQGYLTRQQLRVIYQRDWYRIFVPKSLGGLEIPLPEALMLLEATAYADGSFGWVLNLGAGANLFAAYMHPSLSRALFQYPEVCIAGSGAVSGSAQQQQGGWLINGRWKYASGSSHATAFTANCTLQTTRENLPEFLSFVFLPEEVGVIKSWSSYGLQATASHDFSVQDVLVSENRTFNLLKPSPYETAPLYRFPFAPFAEITTALQTTGIALHFMEEMHELLFRKKGVYGKLKEHPKAQDTMAQTEATLSSARAWLYILTDKAWECCEKEITLTEDLLRKISLAAKHAAQSALESAAMLYPLAGMSILQPHTPLNRAWCDLHTASQHMLLSPLGFHQQSDLIA